MKDQINKGRRGEEEAVKFLIAKGYQILERNWRSGHKEIDIIARDRGTTVFIEVKSRINLGDERYDELITRSKQKTLLAAANAYLALNRSGSSFRFDALFIIGQDPDRRFEHIQDAFDSWE